jgi:hypothetical protein
MSDNFSVALGAFENSFSEKSSYEGRMGGNEGTVVFVKPRKVWATTKLLSGLRTASNMGYKGQNGIHKFLSLTIQPLAPGFISGTKSEDIVSVFFPYVGIGTNRPARPTLSEVEKYWLRWGRAATEVMSCLVTLDYAAQFVGRRYSSSLGGRRMNEDEWMEYHLHMYIQEETILRNRLFAVLAEAKGIAESNGDNDGVKLIRDLEESVKRRFVKPSRIRATHVHTEKWHDARIRNLSSMILFCGLFDETGMPNRFVRTMVGLKKREYASLRKRWKTELAKSNKRMRSFCDDVFSELAHLLPKYAPSNATVIKAPIK